jgi:hypothetical protein
MNTLSDSEKSIFTCITTDGLINDYQNDENEEELHVDASSMTSFLMQTTRRVVTPSIAGK